MSMSLQKLLKPAPEIPADTPEIQSSDTSLRLSYLLEGLHPMGSTDVLNMAGKRI